MTTHLSERSATPARTPNGTAVTSSYGTISVGDVVVNRLGFGAMRITGQGVYGEPPDRHEAIRVVRRAVELGANFIDTADSYGPHVSELILADALHPYPSDLVIATKGGFERPGPGQWTPNGRPDHLRAACEGSLERLRVEQIAVYQFHVPDPAVPYEESIGALAELRKEGKIRHIGVSNVDAGQLRAAQRIAPVVSVQNRYNATDRGSESLVDVCEKEGIPFLPWGPVRTANDSEVISLIAARHGATPHQVVLAWLLARSPAMLPIPGTGSQAHLEENMAAARVELSHHDVAAITNSA